MSITLHDGESHVAHYSNHCDPRNSMPQFIMLLFVLVLSLSSNQYTSTERCMCLLYTLWISSGLYYRNTNSERFLHLCTLDNSESYYPQTGRFFCYITNYVVSCFVLALTCIITTIDTQMKSFIVMYCLWRVVWQEAIVWSLQNIFLKKTSLVALSLSWDCQEYICRMPQGLVWLVEGLSGSCDVMVCLRSF